ncbi:MAG: NAD-dependent dehydratase, partial [Pontibacter sp.]|nr:NAD-dependent dehydratase [Pontibacter sp.]
EYNYAGEVVPSIKNWQGKIAKAAGHKPKYKLYPGWLFKLMGVFSANMREISEMGYLWQNTILLDDSKLRQALPDLYTTPMEQAIAETLAWHREQLGS